MLRKRESEKNLYDQKNDPEQVNNLAANPEHKETIEKLRSQLLEYLRQTDDPRFTDEPVRFDEYHYRKKSGTR